MLIGRDSARRIVAMRAGWNDAAWGRSYRATDSTLTRWYEQGFQGGAAYRAVGRTQPSIEPSGLENPLQFDRESRRAPTNDNQGVVLSIDQTLVTRGGL